MSAAAQNAATTFITGNYSWDHGGGIMSNGDLYLGQPADAYVYPSLKLKATKELSGRDLKDKEFTFTVYRKDLDAAEAPSWKNDKFDTGGCKFVKYAITQFEDLCRVSVHCHQVPKKFLVFSYSVTLLAL